MAKQGVKYTETTGKNLKAVGILDAGKNAILVDGEVVNISALLSEFDGFEISFSLSMKTEIELDTPEVEEDEDEEV